MKTFKFEHKTLIGVTLLVEHATLEEAKDVIRFMGILSSFVEVVPTVFEVDSIPVERSFQPTQEIKKCPHCGQICDGYCWSRRDV